MANDAPKTGGPLLCPNCEFDLRGLESLRCPECGASHEQNQALIERLSSETPQRVCEWESSGGGVAYFLDVWRCTTFEPREFARTFPGTHDTHTAFVYSVWCYFAMMLPLALASAPFAAEAFCGLIVIIPVGGWLTEMAVARVLAWSAPPKCSWRPYHFWRGVMHYMGHYLIVSSGILALGLSAGYAVDGVFGMTVIWVGLALNCLLWWLAIGRMVLARGRVGKRGLAVALVPVAVVVAVVGMYFAVSAVILVLFGLLR